MSKITKNDFIKALKQSGIVELSQLQELLNNHPTETPEAVAQLFIREELITTWQAKFLMTGRTRLNIGSYRLLERIHRDELGDRLLAIHTSLARKVDIQILPAALTEDQKNCDRFIQKASLAAQLDHPHLIHVFDIDQEGGRYFLVTEHIEGQTLEKSTGIEFDELLIAKIIQQAIDGLQHAHQLDVVHGWIGREDLILDAQQNLKIQNLPLSPLRRQLSGTQEQSTVAQDFSAMADIGQSLLKESNLEETDLGVELSELLTQLHTASPESTKNVSGALLSFIQINAAPEPMDFGGFDQPIASTALAPRKMKKNEIEPEAPPVLKEPSGLARLWRDHPIAVIATSCVLGLFLIVASVFGAITALNFSKSTTTVTANLDPSVASPETTPPDGAGQEGEPPTTDKEMQKFLDNLDENNSKNPRDAQDTNVPPVEPNPKVDNPTPPAKTQTPPKTTPPKTTPPKTTPPKTTPPVVVKPEPKTDLTIISGIAEKTQEVLNQGDVKTIDQMAKMSPTEIKLALQKGGRNTANEMKAYRSWIQQSKEIIGDTSPMKQSQPVVATTKPSQPVAAKTPFANFPERFRLPPIEDTKEWKLADLIIKKQYLLGVEIICEEGVSRGKSVFELERSKDDKQKWNVTVRKSAKQRPLPIATFRKSENAFLFQWLTDASTDKTAAKLASNLQNCLLKLKLPEDQGTIVFLRTPVKIPDLRLDKESFSNELEILIPAMPDPETIVVEVLPLRIKGVETAIPNSRVEKNMPAKVWLKRSDKTGFMWIQVAGDLRSKLILKSNLVMRAPNGNITPVQSPKMLNNLAATMENMRKQSQAMHQGYSNANPGQNFATQRNKLAATHQQHNQTNQKLNDYRATIPKIVGQPITVRIYAKLGNYQVPLAVSDPKLEQPKK
jgi:serine/threonine protein kinase